MNTTAPSSADPECTSSSVEWAGLVVSVISINVSWWLFDIPLLWQHGIKRYLESVAWQCYRLHMPAVVAIYALRKATTRQEGPRIYYTGLFHDPDTPSDEGLSKFQYGKALLIDLLTVVATGVTMSTAIHTPANSDISGTNSSLWSFPSLPVAVHGLWILLCSRLDWPRRRTTLLGILVVLVVGAALILPLALASPVERATSVWFPALLGYLVMALPILICPPFVLIGTALVVIDRVGGLALGAISPIAYFPFCQIKGDAFGVTYLVVGAIGGIMAIGGWLRWNWLRH